MNMTDKKQRRVALIAAGTRVEAAARRFKEAVVDIMAMGLVAQDGARVSADVDTLLASIFQEITESRLEGLS